MAVLDLDGTSKNMFGISVGTNRVDIRSNNGIIQIRNKDGLWRSIPQFTKLSTSAPTVNDDAADGIFVGDNWYNYSTDKEYICLDTTIGAAVWREKPQGGGGLTVVKTTDPTVNDDANDGYSIGSNWYNSTLDKEFICLSATVGAAVWRFKPQDRAAHIDTVAPTATDDAAHGYKVADIWFETPTDKEYICLDNTTNAAVWRFMSGGFSPSNYAVRSGEVNTYDRAQTVTPVILTTDTGLVEWNLATGQNAELRMTEDITDWYLTNGEAGRAITLRYTHAAYNLFWDSAQFKGMANFVQPSSGDVTIISFRMQSATVLEFCGQSPSFTEWDF